MAAPSWTDAVSVVAAAKVATAATLRGTLNLTNKFMGVIFIRAMRCTAGTPGAGIYIEVRRLLKGTPFGGTAASDIVHPAVLSSFQDSTTASNGTTLAAGPVANSSTIQLTSATGFAANQILGMCDSTTTPTILEFARSSKISTSTITFDRAMGNASIGNGNIVTNLAIVLPPIFIDGTPNSGDIEVIFDNGAEATVPYVVEAWAQTLDSIA